MSLVPFLLCLTGAGSGVCTNHFIPYGHVSMLYLRYRIVSRMRILHLIPVVIVTPQIVNYMGSHMGSHVGTDMRIHIGSCLNLPFPKRHY